MDETLSRFKDPIMGFLDESSLRSDPNRRRVVNTRVVNYSEGEKRSKTIFGFMALNGNDVVMMSDTAKSEDMGAFLDLVRKENREAPILAVMDNARIYKAWIVRERADELRIEPVYLPPYSPDLQPIEFGWKDVKLELSGILDFDMMIAAGKKTTLELFEARKASYANHWIQNFISDKG